MTPDNLPQQEQEHHRKAFEQYYALGVKRTYRQVSLKLGVSTSTIKLWSRAFHWRHRIQERDAEATRQIADRNTQSVLEDRERDLKIVRMAKMRLTKDIADGKVRGKIPDLDLLIRLETYLSGSQGDPLSWIDRETDAEKLRARLREIAAESEPPAEDATEGRAPDE